MENRNIFLLWNAFQVKGHPSVKRSSCLIMYLVSSSPFSFHPYFPLILLLLFGFSFSSSRLFLIYFRPFPLCHLHLFFLSSFSSIFFFFPPLPLPLPFFTFTSSSIRSKPACFRTRFYVWVGSSPEPPVPDWWCDDSQEWTEPGCYAAEEHWAKASAPGGHNIITRSCVRATLQGRRTTHISAEQKRRTHIKFGFKTLCGLVPALKSQSNVRVISLSVVPCDACFHTNNVLFLSPLALPSPHFKDE